MSEQFTVKGWLADGLEGVRSSIRIEGRLLPEQFHTHLRSSRKEFLMAFRSLFDTAIEKCQEPKEKTQQKTSRIKAE
jgi:hypothetical protein